MTTSMIAVDIVVTVTDTNDVEVMILGGTVEIHAIGTEIASIVLFRATVTNGRVPLIAIMMKIGILM